MSEVNLSKLKKLFQDKRYSDVVLDIESLTTENNRSSALHNMLGVCRSFQKGKSERDVKLALNDFKAAFVAQNIKAGVSILPWGVEIVPTLALLFLSLYLTCHLKLDISFFYKKLS